ncbi:uncharacterized protein LOC112639164 [Camponotus floridanus]|uniref:uncharacterized protein LOC112639164 n=1 Tax=Camponotus floridanus TaxID=104421 RepID=UPI000DC6CC1E|nr:uncharacterized protein LOC112639164 [Camponotus floridanus]
MNNSDNISLANNATSKNAISNSLLIAYGHKSVELKIIKDTISMYQNSFLEKEKVLKEEKQKLEELNYQVWSVEESFCEQVWQFSHEHNFFDIFKYYPFVIKTDHCAKQKNNDKNDIVKDSELTDLINEIDTIKAEIFSLNHEKNIKHEMEIALINLQKLQLIADDITELLKLISPLESPYKLATISIPIYDEVISDSVNKIKRHMNDTGRKNSINKKTCNNQKEKPVKNKSCLKNDISNFTLTNKITIASPKIYPQLSLEKSIVHTAKTTMTDISTEFTCNEKYENFIPKKRSEISIKFEQHRQHIINNY